MPQDDRHPMGHAPVGVLLREEMDARGWDYARFIAKVAQHAPTPLKQTMCMCDLLLYASNIKGMLIEDWLWDAIGKAMGTSPDLWRNLHASFQEHGVEDDWNG